MKYPPITYSLLKEKKACTSQLDLFEQRIGLYEPIQLTDETIPKFSQIFDIDWSAYNLLDSNDWLEFNKSTDPALTEFNKEKLMALDEYRKTLNKAHDKLCKSKTTEFARIYNR
jgi:hypothetical protein